MFNKIKPRIDPQSLLELTIAAEVIYAPHGLSEVAEEVANALGLENPTPEAMIATAGVLARRLFDQVAIPVGTSRDDAFYEITKAAFLDIWYWDLDYVYAAAEVLGPILLSRLRPRPGLTDPDFVVDVLVRFVLALSVMYARLHNDEPALALSLAAK
jgi:hypothetical protein